MKETFEEMASYRISTRFKGKCNSVTSVKDCYPLLCMALKERNRITGSNLQKQILTGTEKDCTSGGKGLSHDVTSGTFPRKSNPN